MLRTSRDWALSGARPCPRKTQQSSTSLTGQLAVTIRQLPSCIVEPCHLSHKTGMVWQFDSTLPGFGIPNPAGFKLYSFNFGGTTGTSRNKSQQVVTSRNKSMSNRSRGPMPWWCSWLTAMSWRSWMPCAPVSCSLKVCWTLNRYKRNEANKINTHHWCKLWINFWTWCESPVFGRYQVVLCVKKEFPIAWGATFDTPHFVYVKWPFGT